MSTSHERLTLKKEDVLNPDTTILIAEEDDGHTAFIEKIYHEPGWTTPAIV